MVSMACGFPILPVQSLREGRTFQCENSRHRYDDIVHCAQVSYFSLVDPNKLSELIMVN